MGAMAAPRPTAAQVVPGVRVAQPSTAASDATAQYQALAPPAAATRAPNGSAGLAEHRRLRRKKRRRRSAVGLVVALAVGAVLATLVKVLAFQFFEVPSASMAPTLQVGDRILVQKFNINRGQLHPGDIVVFHRPPTDQVDPNIADVVKRVVALPGQVVGSSNGHLIVDGQAAAEPYLPPSAVTTKVPTERVPAGHYFVMGDNRQDSYDSRFFGPIQGSSVVGRVVAQVWPPWAFRLF